MQFDANLMHLITCHVVNNLTSSVVFGIDWLMEHRPEIRLAKLYSDNAPGKWQVTTHPRLSCWQQ